MFLYHLLGENRFCKCHTMGWLSALFFFIAVEGIGQGRLQFDRLERVKGLENRSVTSIVQDTLGFVWFGTPDGLIRYDGYEIKLYKNNLKDKNSLGDNNIRGLAKDKAGNLWIATQGAGLDKYDVRTEQFTHFRHAAEDPASLSGNAVWSVFVDSKGMIWAGTWSDGLNRIDPSTNKVNRIEERNYVPVLAIAEDKQGKIWFSSNGINLIDPQNLTLQNFPDSRIAGIRALLPDSEGKIWVGTENNGLFQFDPQESTYQPFSSLKANSIYSIHQEKSGAIWLGGNEGVAILTQGEITLYQHTLTDKYSLSTNTIRIIFQDRIGNIWIGSEGGGINRVLSKKNFQLFRHSDQPGSLSHNLIRSLYEDSRKKIWVGTQGGGLDVWDPDTQKFKPVPVPSKEISSIYEDRDGLFWIGSWGGGLFHYDLTRGVLRNYRQGNENSLRDDRIQIVYRDQMGVLWVGTENGLSQYDLANDRWKHFTKSNFGAELMGTNVQGQAFVESADGTIWIGTWFGLNGISPDRKSVKHITADTASSSYLSSDHVISLCHDSKNNIMWIGTFGGGLNRFDISSGAITHFTEADGLSNNTIFGIKQDQDGNLWLSTNNGLTRFNPLTKVFRNYDATEGLQGNEFYWGAALKTKNGQLFFGGINGLNSFNPAEIKDNASIPPVVITNFEIFNKAVPVRPGTMLEQNINFTEELILPYDQNVISFQYSALNYNSSEKNLYAYKLEHFDKDWNSVSDKRSVSYTNLNPGEYILRIKGSNNDGVWNDTGIALKITVVPPYWKTWWFYGIVGVLVIGLVYLLIKIRLRSVRLDKEQLRMTLQQELDKVHQQLDEEKRAVAEEQEKNRERNWIDQSLSIISEVLSRSKNSVADLCKEILSVLVKRCEVLAGAIYLYDEKTNALAKQTNYGFEAAHHTIALGAGQISECFEKRETIKIDNLPDSYFKVSSGLGSAMPSHLLLVPLQYEGFCVGVIELASFHEIPGYRAQFIEKLSSQVTATIHTTQISQQTGRLLDESKQQMEELKVREEELKQNLEEMTSIQEDFERRRTEYEQTIENLNNKIKELRTGK